MAPAPDISGQRFGLWVVLECFIADMGERPSPDHQIDRRDNDGPYSPENCRWVTQDKQSINRSNVVRLTLNGETKPLVTWARELGISVNALHMRRRQGWPDEKILTTPAKLPGALKRGSHGPIGSRE